MKRNSEYGLKIFFLLPFVLITLFVLLFGCTQITEPEEGVSGVYQSKMYSVEDLARLGIIQTYNIRLELLQRGNIITGVVIDQERYLLNGTIEYDDALKVKRIKAVFTYGNLDLFVNEDGSYYPLSGQCVYYSGARAIRFEKTSELHEQGKIYNN